MKKNTPQHLQTTEGAGIRVLTEKKACYFCDLSSHFFRDCPLKVTQPVEDGKDANKLDKAITCGSLGRHTKEAYLEIEVNGRYYNCLLDTGSHVIIFPYTMVKGIKLHPPTTDLKAANGWSIPLLGETTVKVVRNGRTIKLQGVVTEHMDEVILGLTWLQEQVAVWDFKTGHQTIEGETHLLLDGEDAMICRRLVVQESIFIPARSQMDIPRWIYPVRVMNVLDHPVTWEKGANVNSLEQVNDADDRGNQSGTGPDFQGGLASCG